MDVATICSLPWGVEARRGGFAAPPRLDAPRERGTGVFWGVAESPHHWGLRPHGTTLHRCHHPRGVPPLIPWLLTTTRSAGNRGVRPT